MSQAVTMDQNSLSQLISLEPKHAVRHFSTPEGTHSVEYRHLCTLEFREEPGSEDTLTECEAELLAQRPELRLISKGKRIGNDGVYTRWYYADPQYVKFNPEIKS